jgi:type IV pilus assembly protein PilE
VPSPRFGSSKSRNDNEPVMLISKRRGFSLIELLVVLAVMALLAAMAYPSYESSVRKNRRANAEADLVQLSQFMERIYTENGTYSPGGANPVLPFAVSPQNAARTFYTLVLSVNTGNSYTLRATPIGDQLIDGMIEIDATGAKRWDTDHNGSFGSTEQHW